ncbi:MAG: carbohydrate kinase [Phycisphaerae bacterium]|nr:carbohydrate kinase [Phycisphaerae bacterium]
MDRERLEALLDAIKATSVAVMGDFCIDAYWVLDASGSEISLETGKPTQTVGQQRYGLGGAGNVVNNLVDLGVGQVYAVGVVGDDLFGREMKAMLAAIGVNVGGMVVQSEGWDTAVYGKPYLDREELSRVDFGAFNEISAKTEMHLIANLEKTLKSVQAVILNQQMVRGIKSDTLIERINQVIAAHPDRVFIVDSRHKSARYQGAILKLNDVEAGNLAGTPREVGDVVLLEEVHGYAAKIHKRTRRPVFVTRGSRGCVGYADGGAFDVPGIQILTPVDPVGAGDAAVSAMASALAAGGSVSEAAELGNFAAAVTVKKLEQCGTARPGEIIEIGADPDYIYNPELAEDPRRATHVEGTEIEVISGGLELGRIEHAIFDHDGTISTLRQGWEAIMEPVMVRAILGPRYETADESLYRKVIHTVRDYIDKSTGIQTILQMEALVELVQQFGCVPKGQILDKLGYKRIYNDALMELVRARLAKLERGELDIGDYTMKGAVALLTMLHDRGVTLYMASGTDCEDVIAEAKALGYADLFGDRIYGAVGDVSKYSKKMVVDRILKENKLTGSQLVCFGDGPVELRETKKRGGIAVGVASDEVRRHGLNRDKRARLIRSGADVVVPDFSQGQKLFDYLMAKR